LLVPNGAGIAACVRPIDTRGTVSAHRKDCSMIRQLVCHPARQRRWRA
jgi:hypothetical protein